MLSKLVTKLMQNKRIFLIVLSSTVLLAVIATSVIGILFKDSTTHTSDPSANTGSLLDSQSHQGQDFHYPDPSNQNALPNSVKVTGSGEMVILRASVIEGNQIYECQASKTDPSGFAWKLQAPFALLKADNGTNVIHSTDPTWLYTQDGSEVKGKVGQYTNPNGTVVPANATPNADSVPWLRLDVTEYRGNSGLFNNVNQIQRLYTAGGIAPKDGCNQDAANNHVIKSVTYSAEYVFWGG